MTITNVLFVCMGNICRSPAAEGIFAHMLLKEGLADSVTVDSAGTLSFHTGEPADSRMRAAAKQRGYPLNSRARQVQADDFYNFDLILVMDESNYRDIQNFRPAGTIRAKVRRFCDYCTDGTREIPDPYYGGAKGFDHVLDLLEEGCRQLVAEVKASGTGFTH